MMEALSDSVVLTGEGIKFSLINWDFVFKSVSQILSVSNCSVMILYRNGGFEVKSVPSFVVIHRNLELSLT